MTAPRLRSVVRALRPVGRALRRATGTLVPTRTPRSDGFGYDQGRVRRHKLALLAGFALFVVGVVAAHLSPASGYEVSIYSATPALYWIGTGGAFLLGFGTLLYGYDSELAPLSVALCGLCIVSFLALPLVRDYYFYGFADPMTHLGRIRGLWGGWTTFFDSIYPGSYVLTIFVALFGGLRTPDAMKYVMFTFALVFVTFVPLTVHLIAPDRRALYVGLFSGFLLLPINDVSVNYLFHPFSMATMYTAFVVYLFVGHVTREFDDDALPRVLSASSLLLPVATSGLLFFHPQATTDLLIIFGMVVAVQLLYRIVAPDHPLSNYRAIYGQFAFLAVLFLVWASMHDGAGRTLSLLISSVTRWFSGQAGTAQVVHQRAGSAKSIGVSIYTLFAKLFLVSAVYCLFAGGLVLAKLLGLLNRDDAADATSSTILYFAYGGMGLLPFVVLHSFGKADGYLFRHVGFGMVLVTILGAVGFYYALTSVLDHLSVRTVRALAPAFKPLLGGLAIAALALSLLTVFASPFVYLPGQHVSSYQMHGYESSFEMQPKDRSVWFAGVRQSSNRYEAAMFAAPGEPWGGSPRARSSGAVGDANLSHLRRYYATFPERINRRDHYMVISRKDYQTELVAYDGLRYSRKNLTSVARQPAVYDVYSNGEYRMFYVDTAGSPVVNNSTSTTTTTSSVRPRSVRPRSVRPSGAS